MCHLTDTDGNPVKGDDERKYNVTVRKNEPVVDQVERLEALLEAAFSMHAANSADQTSAATPQATATETPVMTPQKKKGDAVVADIKFLSEILAMNSSPMGQELKTLMNESPYQDLFPSEHAEQRQRVRELISKVAGTRLNFDSPTQPG